MTEAVEIPKELAIQAPKTQEVEKTSLDSILIFGQGPVIDVATREKAENVKTEKGFEDVNLWSDNLAKSASELYKRKVMREIIVMGGETGGEDYKSESELISWYLQKYGVPKNAIKLENRSTNTLENLVNVLNDYLDKDQSSYKDVGVLAANYHLPRIRLLMQLFHIPYKDAFSAEEVVRFIARDKEEWDNTTLLEMERRLDINAAGKTPHPKLAPGYYPKMKGTEQKDIHERVQDEDVFSKYLLEIPQNWIGYLARISNRARMRDILKDQDKNVLKEKFQIDLEDSDKEIIKKLLAITRDWPKDIGKLRGQDYSPETKRKLDEMVEKRASSEVEKPRTRVFVMRHGPTTFNKEKRVQGNVDTDIVSAHSVAFFERIGAKNIPKPDVIVISGLKRARQTADALQQYLGWSDIEIIVNEGFNEKKWGVMEGLTHAEARNLLLQDEELVQKYPYLETEETLKTVWDDQTFKPPGGGESLEEVAVRVKEALKELYNLYPNKNVLLVTHAGVLQTQGLDFGKVSQVNISRNESGNLAVEKID